MKKKIISHEEFNKALEGIDFKVYSSFDLKTYFYYLSDEQLEKVIKNSIEIGKAQKSKKAEEFLK